MNDDDVQELEFLGHTYKVYAPESHRKDVMADHLDELSSRLALWRIAPGDMGLDVGAANGSYATSAIACGAAHAWAWAPQANRGLSEVTALARTLDLNGWRDRCTIYDTGLHRATGWLCVPTQKLYTHNPGPMKLEGYNADDECIQVGILDQWYAENGAALKGHRVWLKMDVEAAELDVIAGGLRFMHEVRPLVFNENHDPIIPGIGKAFRRRMEELGYRELRRMHHWTRSHSLFAPVQP